MKSSDREIAHRLCKQYGIDVRQARYRDDGKWYHHLTHFPAALLDRDGFIIFATKQSYESCAQLSLKEDVHTLRNKGIASIPGYVSFRDAETKISSQPRYGETSDSRLLTLRETGSSFDEGGIKEIALEIQRRNPQLRKMALRQHGKRCQVCAFDFGKTYGPIGDGFIELHHLKPLSLSRAATVTTLDDVAVVCSNCHRMLHRNGVRPLSIQALRDILVKNRDS